MEEMKLPYVPFTVGDEEYKLKINAKSAIELEKKLGVSLVEGMRDFDKIGTATAYLWASLQAYNAGIKESDAIEIYDDYISAGGDISDFADVLTEVLIVSGFLKRSVVENLRAQTEAIKRIAAKASKTPRS